MLSPRSLVLGLRLARSPPVFLASRRGLATPQAEKDLVVEYLEVEQAPGCVTLTPRRITRASWCSV